jgi:hypothetical protein
MMQLETDNDWPSTKGLSVYNVLRIRGAAMKPDEIKAVLCEYHQPVSRQYVVDGIGFLVGKGWVTVGSFGVSLTTPLNKTGKPVAARRTRGDVDLSLVAGGA